MRWVAEPLGALLRPLEATSLVPRPLRSALEATRSHREAVLSRLEAAGKPPRASRSCWDRSPRGLQARKYSRELEKTEVGATWASRAPGASRWLLPKPPEPRDSCSRSLGSLEMAAPGASAASSRSLWSVEMAAPRASGASRQLLPEPLEPRDSWSQSLWGLAMAAPRASGASRRLLPEPLEPTDGCCFEETVEEAVEEASKLVEDP